MNPILKCLKIIIFPTASIGGDKKLSGKIKQI